MVRLRKKDGTAQVLDDQEAIEVVTSDGLLGLVVYLDHRAVVRVLFPGDPLFTGYCRTHRLSAAQVHQHDPPIRPTMKK